MTVGAQRSSIIQSVKTTIGQKNFVVILQVGLAV